MELTKMVLFHNLSDEDDRPMLERWFYRYHVPEVMQQTPWMIRYCMFRPVPPPKGAEAFNYMNYRVHENWTLDKELRRPPRGALAMTDEPGNQSVTGAGILVPGAPTEDFLGDDWSVDQHSIVRWLLMMRYPEGIDERAVDDWYINVHAPEVMKQPGLIRFFSYKGIAMEGNLTPHKKKHGDVDFKKKENDKPKKKYHRLTELWYENNSGWIESVIKNPPAYTAPPWGGYDKYPFFEPGVDLATTFILERPECVYTQNSSPIIW